MEDLRRLLSFAKPYRGYLAVSFVLLMAAGLAEVLTTGLAGILFDDVLISIPVKAQGTSDPLKLIREGLLPLFPGNTLTRLSIALLLFTMVKGLCLYYSNYGMSFVGQSVVMDLRKKLYRHVLNQSMGFFSINSTGRLMSRMNSDVEQVQEAVSVAVADLFREVVLLIYLIGWVFYLDWRLAMLALTIAPSAMILTLTMGRRIRQASLRSRENIASLSDLLQQSITGMRIVKAFGMEHHEENRFQSSADSLFSANMRAARILFLNSPVMEFLGVACFVPLLYYADRRMDEQTLTLGTLGTMLFALFRMYDPIRKLSRLHLQFQRAFASASRITELLDTHVEIHDRPGARELAGVRESVEFRDVSFEYHRSTSQKSVLKNINIKVQRNQVIALVGSSGSGKSTMVGLIPRFYDVTSGAVLIDGIDVRDYTQSSLRKHIAIVTQDTFLFNDTVLANIAYGDIHASAERIESASRAALAHGFIMHMPQQYETRIGERGQRLSGGERQRISIARAILRNAPILILDEATSALDSESEQLVQQALANLMRDRTTFVIAHRLSTIRSADLIVVIDKGKILESGTHEGLLEANGLYSRFFRLQTEDVFLQARRTKPDS
jgi:subfamily B ATP-binding cassette protein MsbA